MFEDQLPTGSYSDYTDCGRSWPKIKDFYPMTPVMIDRLGKIHPCPTDVNDRDAMCIDCMMVTTRREIHSEDDRGYTIYQWSKYIMEYTIFQHPTKKQECRLKTMFFRFVKEHEGVVYDKTHHWYGESVQENECDLVGIYFLSNDPHGTTHDHWGLHEGTVDHPKDNSLDYYVHVKDLPQTISAERLDALFPNDYDPFEYRYSDHVGMDLDQNLTPQDIAHIASTIYHCGIDVCNIVDAFLAQLPNTPPEILRDRLFNFAPHVCANPVLPLLALEAPDMFNEMFLKAIRYGDAYKGYYKFPAICSIALIGLHPKVSARIRQFWQKKGLVK